MSVVHLLHLAKRFATSLWPGSVSAVDEQWVQSYLHDGLGQIWAQMSNQDQRHAAQVARRVVAQLGEDSVDVVTAALFHDSGKIVSQLGTFSRVAATVLWAVLDTGRARSWSLDDREGIRKRFGQYRLHPELGSELLASTGAGPLTVAWAGEHHLSPHRWTVDPGVASVLKTCDDD